MNVANVDPTAGPPASWRRVAWIGSLFIALVAALAAWDVVRGYHDGVHQTGHELDSQALVIAEQTARSLQTVDLVLRHIEEEVKSGAALTASHGDLKAWLADQAVGLMQIEGLVLLDAKGQVRAQSNDDENPQVAPSGWTEAAFTALQGDSAAGLFVGHTTRTANGDGPWVFPMVRRLETADGRFAGLVAALGRIEYFRKFYDDVHLADGTKINLIHLDGTLLARHPEIQSALGQRFALSDEVLAQHAPGDGEPLRVTSPLDGVERFGALARVAGYPLALVVTRDQSLALAPWRAQTDGTVLRTLALGLLAAGLLALLRRQFMRLHEMRESLEVSRERFALAAAGSDVGIWDWDIAGDRVFASPRALQIYGLDSHGESCSRGEWFSAMRSPQRLGEASLLPGRRDEWFVAIRIHPDDVARRDQDIRAHLAGETSAYFGEYRVHRGDGMYRWVRVHGVCVRDTDGKPLRMAGSVADIDLQKRAEDALRLSEERFALAVAGSDDGVWDFDYTKDEAFASRRAREIMGLPLLPEVQRPLRQWVAALPMHPDDAAAQYEAVLAHRAGRTPAFAGEWRFRRPGGGWRWVRVRGVCVRDAQGQPLRMAGSVSDIDARKRAEESLRQSEERYALAVAGSDDGVWDWDYEAGLAFESVRARELQGLPTQPEQQPLEQLVASLRVHPDDAPRRAAAIRAHLADETPAYECEYRVLHDDGSYRWIRVRALCVRDGAGVPRRMAGSVTDIDSRKRAENALRQSEERFALAVAGSNDGILDWDIVNDSMYVSERAIEIAGIDACATVRTRADWAAMFFPTLHPDDAERLSAVIGGLQNDGRHVHDGEYRVRQSDGEYRWVRFRGMHVRDADSHPIRWAGSVSDIDAAKKVEEALRRSEERYELAVAGSNEGLWDWDLESDRLFLSLRAQELLWLEPSEPQRPRHYWIDNTHYHPDDIGMVRAAISAHLRGKTKHFMVEYRLRHHSGEWHWYRQRGIAVRDAQGRPTRMAGSMEDITDRKNAEVLRERLEAQLRQAQKLEAIGTLAGGIAHDFNNILAAILGYGEMAQKDAPGGTALRRHIDSAISAGMRAKSLVERILAFSRSGVGERVAIHAESAIGEALDAVAASLPPGVHLTRQLKAGDAAVLGDPTQLHQVVMNLCANAVQAMRSSGELTVVLDRIELAMPNCATCRLSSGNYLRIAVRDTGNGIAADVLERIFDPFFTTKEIGVGTGLGLSLVHGIVTDLGGGVEVESKLGAGSTFTVFLPLHNGVAMLVTAGETAAPRGCGETILLVDDEEALVRLGEEMIADLGYEPVGFTSGGAALDAFNAEPERFHAVLSDEAMPGVTGSELALGIRKIRPDIPIVLMSGYVTPALAARARDSGVIDVLMKPLVSRDIARSLAGALRRSVESIPDETARAAADTSA